MIVGVDAIKSVAARLPPCVGPSERRRDQHDRRRDREGGARGVGGLALVEQARELLVAVIRYSVERERRVRCRGTAASCHSANEIGPSSDDEHSRSARSFPSALILS